MSTTLRTQKISFVLGRATKAEARKKYYFTHTHRKHLKRGFNLFLGNVAVFTKLKQIEQTKVDKNFSTPHFLRWSGTPYNQVLLKNTGDIILDQALVFLFLRLQIKSLRK